MVKCQQHKAKNMILGMLIKYKNGKLRINMKKHILKAKDEFIEKIIRNASTPANNYLYKTRDTKKLDPKQANNFHSMVALLLFVSKKCHLDIQIAIAFLCTQVADLNEDNWNKL